MCIRDSYGAQYGEYQVNSIFFGGGTPTILEGYQLAAILETVKEHFNITTDAEITVECNPGTLTAGKAEKLVQAGFNRLSMGLQSADDRELHLLGRIHNFAQFLESYDLARKAGFQNINVDLMSALPGQTLKSWQDTLQLSLIHIYRRMILQYFLNSRSCYIIRMIPVCIIDSRIM